MSRFPQTLSVNQHRKLCSKISADLATRQLDELFTSGQASLELQDTLCDHQNTTTDEFITLVTSQLKTSYQYVLLDLLEAEQKAILDKDKQFLRLTKTHLNIISALQKKPAYSELSDAQLIEVALLKLIQSS